MQPEKTSTNGGGLAGPFPHPVIFKKGTVKGGVTLMQGHNPILSWMEWKTSSYPSKPKKVFRLPTAEAKWVRHLWQHEETGAGHKAGS